MGFRIGCPRCEQGGRVVKRLAAALVAVDETDEEAGVADPRVELLEDFEILRNEPRFEDEILRRIAGDGEFRREDEFGAGARRVARRRRRSSQNCRFRSPTVGLIWAKPIFMPGTQIMRDADERQSLSGALATARSLLRAPYACSRRSGRHQRRSTKTLPHWQRQAARNAGDHANDDFLDKRGVHLDCFLSTSGATSRRGETVPLPADE